MRRAILLSSLMIIGAALIGGGWLFAGKFENVSSLFPSNIFSGADAETHSKETRFIMDVYDTIDAHYFNDLNAETLTDFFLRGTERIAGTKPDIATTTRAALAEGIEETVASLPEPERTSFATDLAMLVLQSLPPQGRSGLYSEKRQEQLKNTVNNINPGRDLYKTLGTEQGASPEKVVKAAKAKKEALAKENTPEAKAELEKVEYAEEVLTDPENKERYDTVRAEPTVFIKRVTDDIVHLYIKRFSGATLKEFVEAVQTIESSGAEPSVLILDLRGNLGGAIDSMPKFLGPFIGPNATALEVLTQGERESIKTQTGWLNELVRYKQVVVLVDEKAQSTAEVMAAALKKYNVGTLVGKTTRGWGTIERLFPIEHQISTSTKYSVFLVHTITLNNNGQPIEGNGVAPHVSIGESKEWRSELFRYTRNQALVDTVEKLWNSRLPGNF